MGSKSNGFSPELIGFIDELRGLAILAVIVFHLGFEELANHVSASRLPLFSTFHLDRFLTAFAQFAHCGWVGVDLFFMISGFLVGTQILQMSGSGGWLKEFYLRRASRLVPLYWLAVLVAVAFQQKWEPAVHSFLFVSNLTHLTHVPMLLIDFWSLDQEIQFYLLLPLFVLWFSKFGKVRAIYGWVLGLFVLSWSLRAYHLGHGFGWLSTYYLPWNRLEGFAIGLGAASGFERCREKFESRFRILALPGFGIAIGLILAGFVYGPNSILDYRTGMGRQWAYSIWNALLGLWVLGRLFHPRPIFFRFQPWLQRIGRRCFEIYVLHAVIDQVWSTAYEQVPFTAKIFVLSFCLVGVVPLVLSVPVAKWNQFVRAKVLAWGGSGVRLFE